MSEWKIEEVNGPITSGMEKQPFINFDVKKKSFMAMRDVI